MPGTFYAPVVARIFLMGFSLAQPFLVYTTLTYILFPRSETKGSLLIFGYVLVFVGYAVSYMLHPLLQSMTDPKCNSSPTPYTGSWLNASR